MWHRALWGVRDEKTGFSNLSVDFESASSAISWEAAWDTTLFTIRFQSSLGGGSVHRSGMMGKSYRDSMLSMCITHLLFHDILTRNHLSGSSVHHER